MKIVIYNPHTKGWNKFIESLGSNCRGEERDKAVQAYIEKTGQEVSATEFLKNRYVYTDLFGDLRYRFVGEPNNPLEKLVKFVYNGSYIDRKRKAPEDFTESRTDWDDMVSYADEMADFIEDLMEDMATRWDTVKKVLK